MGNMISLDQAWELMDAVVPKGRCVTRSVALNEAMSCLCVENLQSRVDMPPFDKSAMDGYALLAGDTSASFEVLETVPAGAVPTRSLAPGKTIKVMTGAPVPAQTDRVVKVEQTREEAGRMYLLESDPVDNICRQGEDVRQGDIILHAPRYLGPLEIGNLAAAGISEILVAEPVSVAILCTGDELVDDPALLQPGRIMNANGPLLAALCRQYGLVVKERVIVPDTRAATQKTLREAMDRTDLVLLSGGVSVGDFDYVAEAMQSLGLTIHFDRVAIKPGKPVTFAASDDALVLGLPGNPVAVFLTFHLFALRAARRLAGQAITPRFISLPLTRSYRRRKADRCAFIPCRQTDGGGVEAVDYHGTAHLQALMESDGFFMVPSGVTSVGADEPVKFIGYPEGWV